MYLACDVTGTQAFEYFLKIHTRDTAPKQPGQGSFVTFPDLHTDLLVDETLLLRLLPQEFSRICSDFLATLKTCPRTEGPGQMEIAGKRKAWGEVPRGKGTVSHFHFETKPALLCQSLSMLPIKNGIQQECPRSLIFHRGISWLRAIRLAIQDGQHLTQDPTSQTYMDSCPKDNKRVTSNPSGSLNEITESSYVKRSASSHRTSMFSVSREVQKWTRMTDFQLVKLWGKQNGSHI